MPNSSSIDIQCPDCSAKFRVKRAALEGSTKSSIRCPKCGGAIPLPSDPEEEDITQPGGRERSRTEVGAPGPSPRDDELRALLRKAKKERKSSSNARRDTQRRPTHSGREPSPDETQPDAQPAGARAASPEDEIAATMPVGSGAVRAAEFAPTRSPRSPGSSAQRPRLDTPRAGAQMFSGSVSFDQAPDEPTFVGPMPGRAPKITPTERDLGKFLVPGNYMVRVEDVVYAPVPHETVGELVDRGVLLGVDEIAAEDGEWTRIAGQGPLDGLRERLSHRAHHMLARVADGRPASDFGRPPPPDEPEPEVEIGPGDIGTPAATDDLDEEIPEPVRTDTIGMPAEKEIPAPAKTRRSRKFLGLMVTVAVVAGVSAAFVIPSVTRTLDEPAQTPAPVVDDPATSSPDIVETEVLDPVPAYLSAKATVESSIAVADRVDGLLTTAIETGADEKLVTQLTWWKWQRAPESVDSEELVSRLMADGEYRAARQVANWILTKDGKSERLEKLVGESIDKQFARDEPTTIGTDEFARLERVEPGQRPALVFEKQDGSRWSFWPDLGKNAWRGDIAVYRLCQLMVCHFEIPETREARIDRKTFKALVAKAPSAESETARRLMSDFAWGEDDIVRGSLRRSGRGARWPIEATTIWRSWLTAGTGTAKLDGPTDEAHHAVAFFGAEKVDDELGGISARRLARQISDILLIDYLVGNYNRFAPTEENWGTRTRMVKGLVVSVDDSAAFLSEDSVRVRGRFSWASRFSKTTIDSLKNLDEKRVNELLFPDATPEEAEKLDSFWSQRKKALRRVDKLVKKYGAKDVFSLDPPAESAP